MQDIRNNYRQWLRAQLCESLRTQHEADVLSFFMDDIRQITIEEVYFHLLRSGIRAPRRTTASILGISRESVRKGTAAH